MGCRQRRSNEIVQNGSLIERKAKTQVRLLRNRKIPMGDLNRIEQLNNGTELTKRRRDQNRTEQLENWIE